MSSQVQSHKDSSADLFKSTAATLKTLPNNIVLVHATNCLGEWGAGVAKAIAEIWPADNNVYTLHCRGKTKGQLEGKCLLISPQRNQTDVTVKKQKKSSSSDSNKGQKDNTPRVWIACLFTSYGYGRPTKKKAGKDTKAKIIEYTDSALKDLRKQLEDLQETDLERQSDENDGRDSDGNVQSNTNAKKRKRDGDDHAKPSTSIYSPKFNSGSFGVPWEQTSAIIEEIFKDWKGEWFVLGPP